MDLEALLLDLQRWKERDAKKPDHSAFYVACGVAVAGGLAMFGAGWLTSWSLQYWIVGPSIWIVAATWSVLGKELARRGLGSPLPAVAGGVLGLCCGLLTTIAMPIPWIPPSAPYNEAWMPIWRVFGGTAMALLGSQIVSVSAQRYAEELEDSRIIRNPTGTPFKTTGLIVLAGALVGMAASLPDLTLGVRSPLFAGAVAIVMMVLNDAGRWSADRRAPRYVVPALGALIGATLGFFYALLPMIVYDNFEIPGDWHSPLEVTLLVVGLAAMGAAFAWMTEREAGRELEKARKWDEVEQILHDLPAAQ